MTYDRSRKICLEEQLSKGGKDFEHRKPKMQLVLCCSLSGSGGRYPTQINGTRRLLRFTITQKISPRVAVTNMVLASEPFCCRAVPAQQNKVKQLNYEIQTDCVVEITGEIIPKSKCTSFGCCTYLLNLQTKFSNQVNMH